MNEKHEKTKQVDENSWQRDIEKRCYYYDDAFGYEKYDSETAEKINESFTTTDEISLLEE